MTNAHDAKSAVFVSLIFIPFYTINIKNSYQTVVCKGQTIRLAG